MPQAQPAPAEADRRTLEPSQAEATAHRRFAEMADEGEKHLMSALKLTPKIAASIALTLLVTSGVGFFVTQNRINAQAQDAFVDKLRKTDGMASRVRTFFSANVDLYVPNHEFKQVKQVPVVVAWSIAREYAESQGMKFSTPSLQPGNPQNAPDDFEREALSKFAGDSELKEYFKQTVVNGQDVMRYAQPVRLTEDCLFCHGSPAGAKDPFGYVKEGMKVGDLRGAFVVTAPLTAVQEAAAGDRSALLWLSGMTMFLAVAVVFFLVRRIVVKPVAEAAALANQIANNNLTGADIKIRAHDEIGQAGAALNKMKNNLRELIERERLATQELGQKVESILAVVSAASQGDLTQDIPVRGSDAIGQMGEGLGKFFADLRKSIGSIGASAMSLASASEELTTVSHQMSANAEETSAQTKVVSGATLQVSQNLQTVATGAEEMGASIKEIAKNATEAAKIANSAVRAAETANSTVSKLGDSSAEIGQVIKVITSIAQQTNLLALNATIEAARAGEAGKGFAVVANEVKELAKKTAKATEDISRKIETIQVDAKAAVDSIGTISEVINQINGISNTIATAVEEQNATTNEMARNVSEAAHGSGEIISNIAGVAEAAESTSRGASDTQKAAQQLVETSAELRRLVEQFKIDESGNGHGNDMGAVQAHSKRARAGS